jgi:SAM-dependent methyltransferase
MFGRGAKVAPVVLPEGFSPHVYRKFNLDLATLDDQGLIEHFVAHSHERRIFGPTSGTVEFLSMRWLRGQGIEVGAGSRPTPLFGRAVAALDDRDEGLVFGGQADKTSFRGAIDGPGFAEGRRACFDFLVASHVLEHCDSFIRALKNALDVLVPGGVLYLVLPDINFLPDKDFIPFHGFDHHVEDFEDPGCHAEAHMQDHLLGIQHAPQAYNKEIALPPSYLEGLVNGRIPESYWFIHHKHNYDFHGWLMLILQSLEFLDTDAKLVDSRYGHERLDCHFVLQRGTRST